MKTIKKQSGFTLIELMIVISIIGLLAAVALPAYTTYVKRAHVFEGLSLSSSVKFAMYEFHNRNAAWPVSNLEAEIPSPELISGQSTESIAINNGSIIITYNSKVVANQNIIITPTVDNGSILWDCTGGTVPMNFRPSACRQ